MSVEISNIQYFSAIGVDLFSFHHCECYWPLILHAVSHLILLLHVFSKLDNDVSYTSPVL